MSSHSACEKKGEETTKSALSHGQVLSVLITREWLVLTVLIGY